MYSLILCWINENSSLIMIMFRSFIVKTILVRRYLEFVFFIFLLLFILRKNCSSSNWIIKYNFCETWIWNEHVVSNNDLWDYYPLLPLQKTVTSCKSKWTKRGFKKWRSSSYYKRNFVCYAQHVYTIKIVQIFWKLSNFGIFFILC